MCVCVFKTVSFGKEISGSMQKGKVGELEMKADDW